MSRRILFGVSASWGRFVLVTLIGLLQTPILFHYLPSPELGVWYLFFTVASFLFLSDLGLPSSFGRAVSYIWGGSCATKEGGIDAVPAFYRQIPLADLYRSALLASLFMALIVALVGFPLASLYLQQVVTDPILQNRAHWALIIFLGGVVGTLLAAIPNACLSGLGDVGWDNAVRTGTQVSGFVLVLVFVPLYPDIRTLALIYLFQGIVAFLAGHWILVRRHRLPGWFQGCSQLSAIRKMYVESLPILVTRLGVWLVLESNLMIAGYLLGAARIPDFAALRQVVNMGMSISTSIPIALAPYAAASFSAGNMDKVRYYYQNAVRYSLLLAALWTAGLLVWAPRLLDAWLGTGHFVGYAVLVPLVLACFLELHHSSHCFFVWSTGRWPFMTSSVVGGLLNLVFAFVGCSYYGFAGLAWGTLLAQLFTNNWYGVYFTLRHLEVKLGNYLRKIFIPAVVYLIALVAAGVAIRTVIEKIMANELLSGYSRRVLFVEVGIGVVLTIAVALVVAWWGLFCSSDRSEVLQVLLRGRSEKGRG